MTNGFGNLTQKYATRGSVPTIVMTVDGATNRVSSSGGSAFGYDLNGNMTSGPTVSNSAPLQYDYRNRVLRSGPSLDVPQPMYMYDAANRRVWKGKLLGADLGEETVFLYGPDGRQAGSYMLGVTMVNGLRWLTLTVQKAHIYFAGNEVAYQDGSGYHAPGPVEDRLGSEMSYYPYGEEKGTVTANERVKYATHWRDAESGLGYGVNRYYSSSMGRFLTADPYAGSMHRTNPGSFNRYAYVTNNPVNGNEPSGEDEADLSHRSRLTAAFYFM